eukprot:760421-Rhodomonas_salina.2
MSDWMPPVVRLSSCNVDFAARWNGEGCDTQPSSHGVRNGVELCPSGLHFCHGPRCDPYTVREYRMESRWDQVKALAVAVGMPFEFGSCTFHSCQNVRYLCRGVASDGKAKAEIRYGCVRGEMCEPLTVVTYLASVEFGL